MAALESLSQSAADLEQPKAKYIQHNLDVEVDGHQERGAD